MIGVSKWQRQPTQPIEFDQNSLFASSLVSLAIFTRGEWKECGPHGGCAPFTRAGTLTSTWSPGPDAFGATTRGREAVNVATQTATAGDGYTYSYGRNIIPSTASELTIFGMGYSTVIDTSSKVMAAWGNTTNYVARINHGFGSGNGIRTFFNHTTGTSERGYGVPVANTMYFVSGSKTVASATAPNGYINGVAAAGTTTNLTTPLVISADIIGVGRNNYSSTTSSLPGGMAIVGAFLKHLTPEEHLELWENPWQLVRPRRARIFSFPSGSSVPSISSVDNSNKFIDDTTLVITGTGFTGATNVYITQAATDSELTIASITGDTTITITTPSVQDTQATYGAATIKVVGPGGTSTDFAITIEKNAAHQQVTLAGHTTGTGWATDLASANGDTLVAPLTQSGSTIVLGADGAISFTPELTNGTLVYRAWYDVGTKTWAEDQVTITDGIEATGGAGLTLTLELRI